MHRNNFGNFYTREIYAIPIPIGFIPIPIPIPIMSRMAIPFPWEWDSHGVSHSHAHLYFQGLACANCAWLKDGKLRSVRTPVAECKFLDQSTRLEIALLEVNCGHSSQSATLVVSCIR